MDPDRRKPRADAARNHARLIEAARRVLGQGGPEASLEAVARSAGVGIGTLYRHFPTREALFQSVYRHEVAHLMEMATRLEAEPDPVEALRAWLHAGVALVANKRGLLGAPVGMLTGDSRALRTELYEGMTAAVGRLLHRAIAGGALRRDTTTDDLLQTLFAFCYARQPEPGWEARVTRLLDIFVDGLRRREGPDPRGAGPLSLRA